MTHQEQSPSNTVNISTLMAELEKMPLPDKLKNWNQVVEFRIIEDQEPYQIIVENGRVQIVHSSLRTPGLVYTGKEAQIVNLFLRTDTDNVLSYTGGSIKDTIQWGIFQLKATIFLQKKDTTEVNTPTPDRQSVKEAKSRIIKWLAYAIPSVVGYWLVVWLLWDRNTLAIVLGFVVFLVALIIKVALEIVKHKLYQKL